jgi:hypothetical protein
MTDKDEASDLLSELAQEAQTEAESSPAPTDALETLQALGAEVNRIDDWLERAEALIKERKARKNTILGREMVDIMKEKNINYVGVEGRDFSLTTHYHASIPEEKRDEAHDWLEHHEYSDLIKYQIIVTMPKDSEEQVKKITAAIAQITNQAEVEVKRAVPWKRLTSWVKEYMEKLLPQDPKLPPLPMEILGASAGSVVKVKDK